MQHFYVPAKSCARHVLGISGMKKELLTLLACAALLFSGCKQNEPTRQLATTDLVGTWGVSSIQTPTTIPIIDRYIIILANGT